MSPPLIFQSKWTMIQSQGLSMQCRLAPVGCFLFCPGTTPRIAQGSFLVGLSGPDEVPGLNPG